MSGSHPGGAYARRTEPEPPDVEQDLPLGLAAPEPDAPEPDAPGSDAPEPDAPAAFEPPAPPVQSRPVDLRKRPVDTGATGETLPPRPAPDRAPTSRAVLVAAGVVVLVLLVAFGIVAYRAYDGTQVNRARGEAVDAAVLAVQDVLSYDHRTIDADVASARARLTGEALEEYSMSAEALPDAARANQGVQTVTVSGKATSVVSASEDEVELLVFADTLLQRTDLERPRLDQNRVRMLMVRADDTWLVAELEAL